MSILVLELDQNRGFYSHITRRDGTDMDEFRVIEIKRSVFEDNDRDADLLREELRKEGTFLVNLMSSPGSGKTTFLSAILPRLIEMGYRVGVMEADIDSDVDARTISELGVRTIQLHTGGMCHLDADMTRQGLKAFGTDELDIVFLENVGNLVCPAEFDTGAVRNIMLLSTPEGDDKPLKYPLMFSIVSVALITKMDVAHLFDFSLEKVTERIHDIKEDTLVMPISAKRNEGLEPFLEWLDREAKAFIDR